MTFRVQFRLRIYRDDGIAIGPGKIALLEAIADSGSISAAARSLGMSYRRAWLLVDELNRGMTSPAVIGTVGGRQGGGATVTASGQELVRRYRAIEESAQEAAARDIAALVRMLRP
ncbi:MAG: LysR family transcriptional regulator [Burkholderiaceae bacterium]|nr:LysR family transcriptional regulator [Burkholderiaceae bacterium]